MAAGMAATSIPIIIHLLNKRKFRIVVWAAMEWLLAAQRRNARRLRFQRWLLWAIRCLALLVIAAGIAELVFQGTALGSFLGEQRAVVIVWDDSYSMGYQQGAGPGGGTLTAFEQSKRLITDYVSRLKSGDKVMVIRASTQGVTEGLANKPNADHEGVVVQIKAARLSDAATNLPAALDRAKQVLTELEAETRSRQLLLVTDCTNSSIHDPKRGVGADNMIEGIDGERLKKAAQGAIAHATDFHLIDEGLDGQMNLAMTGLVTRLPVAVAGMATELQVELFNGSDTPRLDVPVSVLVDGVPVQTLKVGRVEPGSFQSALTTINVAAAGRHLVEAKLGGDLLPVDDTRRLMLNVRKEIPVLLVDGSPGDGGKTSYGSTFYLYAVYGLPIEEKTAAGGVAGRPGTRFAPRIVTELELPTTALANYDVVVLSDTADPGPAMRESLKQFVAGGGLLVIFPGNRTNAQQMNAAFGEQGANLLPATLGQPVKLQTVDQVAEGIAFAPEGYQKNPVMQVFAAAAKEGKDVGFTSVQTMQYLTLGVPTDGSTETVLRYQKKDNTPGDAAVVMKRDVGADKTKGLPGGTVVLFAGSADMAWNTWGAKPSFLPFIHELTYYGMGRGTLGAGAGLTMEVGHAISLPADLASSGPWIGPREERISVMQEIKDGRAMLTSAPLTMAGTYAPTSGDMRPVVAVNCEAREADVRHVAPAQMAGALGIEAKTIMERPAALEWSQAMASQSGSSWLGPGLIGGALFLFALEALLALMFSTYR
jgi:hypothetical protein